MTQITTVLGNIAPSKLGFTSMHEHTVSDMSVFRRRWEQLIPDSATVAATDPISLNNLGRLKHAFILAHDVLNLNDEELFTAEVADFAASGGEAIVDMSTPGIRCDLPAIRRISEKTGVHIIATTGLYAEDSWPMRFRDMKRDDYVRFMLQEIKEGIEDTAIHAGHIKIAITDSMAFSVQPFSEQQKTLLRAAIRTSNETGLSISVHPPLDGIENVRKVAKLMLEEGVNPARVVIAHNDVYFVCTDLKTLVTNPDSRHVKVDFAKELLDKGFNISLDTFGQYMDAEPVGMTVATDWQRLAGLFALIKAGYSSQIVLGTDTFLKILTRRYGGEGYCRLTEFVVPFLRQIDIADSDIRKMTIENPARILAH